MSKYKLIQGDCLQVLPTLEDESIDLVITSPPYNLEKDYEEKLKEQEYLDFIQEVMRECFRVLKRGGRICWNVLHQCRVGRDGNLFPLAAQSSNKLEEAGFSFFDHLIWDQGYSDSATAWGSWLSPSAPFIRHRTEAILVFFKETWKLQNKGTSDLTKKEFMEWTNNEVWSIHPESAKRIGHPAPFPEELPRRCMKLFSYVDSMILDPFIGSGTTMKVAQENRRSCIGIEKEPDYIKLVYQRCFGRQFLDRKAEYEFSQFTNKGEEDGLS